MKWTLDTDNHFMVSEKFYIDVEQITSPYEALSGRIVIGIYYNLYDNKDKLILGTQNLEEALRKAQVLNNTSELTIIERLERLERQILGNTNNLSCFL